MRPWSHDPGTSSPGRSVYWMTMLMVTMAELVVPSLTRNLNESAPVRKAVVGDDAEWTEF